MMWHSTSGIVEGGRLKSLPLSSQSPFSTRKAFTLIELLIVVAIIAILAAIAVPNFLEAQTRAKIARMEAELKTVATALEVYAVDHRRYPKYGHWQDRKLPTDVMTFVPTVLTTPISYLSTIPNDIFPNARSGAGDIGAGVFSPVRYFHNYEELYVFPDGTAKLLQGGHVSEHYRYFFGREGAIMWQLFSRGPDRIENHGLVVYDASNGTLSRGDIIRWGP